MPGPITTSQSVSGFDPRTIAGCVLWMDGADTSSMSISGTSVSQWRDKTLSGVIMSNVGTCAFVGPSTSFNFAAPSYVSGGGVNFVNTSGGVYSSGVTQGLVGYNTSSTISLNSTSITIFLVAKSSAGSALSTYCNPFLLGQAFSGGFNAINICQSGYPTEYYIDYPYGPGGGYVAAYNTFYTGTITLMTFVLSTTAATWYEQCGASTGSSSWTYDSAYTLNTEVGFACRGGTCGYSGIIYEALVYNTPLVSSQIKSIEAYLAWKWNSSVIPSTQPFYFTRPLSRPFIPFDIPGCAIWLDGADRLTMLQSGGAPVTTSGQSIATWVDKAQNFSFTTGGQYSNWTTYTPNAPTFGTSNGVFFNNTTSSLGSSEVGLGIYRTSSPLFYAPTQSMTIITVTLPTYNNSYRRITQFGTYPLSGGPPNFLLGPQLGAAEGGSLLYDLNSGGSAWGQANYTNTGYNSNITMRIDTMISAPGATQWWWTNGTLNTFQYSNAYTSSYSNYPVNFFYLGCYTGNIDGGRCFAGTIYEVLYYTTALTTTQRRQVEGYLAWKWGFMSSISSNPYTKFSPSSPLPFSPLSIAGCLMWLDPVTFTGTGASTSWADRSGNGYTMAYNASYTSPPTLTTSPKINGNNVVSFTGTSACRLTGTITFPNNQRSIFIVLRPTGMSSGVGANISLFGPSSGGFLSMSLQPYSGSTPYYWFMTNTGNYFTMATQSATLPALNAICMMAAVNSATVANNILTLNGITQALDLANNAANFSSGATTQFLGGGGGGTAGNWDCCEMLFYSTDITPSQRQQVEGYLAWKWAITLPSTHPYYKIVPAHAYAS